jgi:ribose-phosphate pyrophosphokinase
MIIISGPASRELGGKVAQLTDAKTVAVDLRTFPDGESKIRLAGEVEGEEVVIIQSTEPPQDTHLMQLLLMTDTAKDLGANRIVTVVPYLAYARQDKRFLPGEAVSIETIIKLLETSGTERFLTVNTHEKRVLGKFKVPAENLSAIGLLADYLQSTGFDGAFSLAPDRGALELAQEADKVLNGGSGWLKKERDRYTGEISVAQKKFNLKDRDVAILDDIISTGGTVAAAASIVKKQGARRVHVACVHPLLIGDAQKKILKSGADKIIGTDCVTSPVSVVSVAPLIAEALSR